MWGLKYACIVQNLTTSLNDRTITEVRGTHLDGKTNDDVFKVLINHQFTPYLPHNLGAHFKNLEILYVMKSNLSHLTHGDLDGLTKLRIFDVSYNPVKRLHRDYFKGHESIEIISFYDCQLNFIEKGALEWLVNLQEGHFQYNECIDYRGDDVSLLGEMMEEIKEYCEDPYRTNFKRTTTNSIFDDDYSWDDIVTNTPSTTTERLTTTRWSSTRRPNKESSEALPIRESFVRRNAYAIIVILVVIIVAFGLAFYKFNAFNRQNWR